MQNIQEIEKKHTEKSVIESVNCITL